MAGLITKKLKSMAIGTYVEFRYGNGEIACGVITDNDYETSIELTTDTGEEQILEYDFIHGITAKVRPTEAPAMIPPIPAVRSNGWDMQSGSGGKGSQAQKAPIWKGGAGSAAEAPMEHMLSNSDQVLKMLFEQLSKTEKKKLNGAYDSFKYGVKNHDKGKIVQAANQIYNTFRFGLRQNSAWSVPAARFCGLLLSRADHYDPDTFLSVHCFYEAAICAAHQKKMSNTGAYALLALLEGDGDTAEEMLALLAEASLHCQDSSAVPVLRRMKQCAVYANRLSDQLLEQKGTRLTSKQNPDDVDRMLTALYPNTDIVKYAEKWLPEETAPEKSALQSDGIYGQIKKVVWANDTGTILGKDGKTYQFHYRDITDPKLEKMIRACNRTDLGGNTYWVIFRPNNDRALDIKSDKPALLRARAAVDANCFQEAIQYYIEAVNTSDDTTTALIELVEYAVRQYQNDYERDALAVTEEAYRTHRKSYLKDAKPLSFLSQLYYYLGDDGQALSLSEQALKFPRLPANLRTTFLAHHMRFCLQAYTNSGDKKYLYDLLQKEEEWMQIYEQECLNDTPMFHKHYCSVLEYRFRADCALERLSDAESDYQTMSQEFPNAAGLPEWTDQLNALRERLRPEEEENTAPKQTEEPPQSLTDTVPVQEEPPADENVDNNELETDADYEDEDEYDTSAELDCGLKEIDVPPYQDREGWSALGMTKREAADYAMNITGPDRLPALLAYLHAGAALNPELEPLYQVAALAANDPMMSPDYSIANLLNALSQKDSDYPVFSDYCMGAAFLRASFLSGKGYDYDAQSLRDGITVLREIPVMNDACNTMEEFRTITERAIDIYAGYRSHGAKALEEALEQTVRQAGELYLKFILTRPREGVKFARLLKTKEIVFNRDGYLAAMLQLVMNRDKEALDAAAGEFAENYLNGSTQFAVGQISDAQIDALIADAWEQAGRQLQRKKVNATLQGDRRNNLRSNIHDILRVICQWYDLSEQSAGLSWRTELGEHTFQQLAPQLMAQLDELSRVCEEESTHSVTAERRMGAFLLSVTARELSARLSGAWKFEETKYLYAGFLRNDYICLDENFLPELSATFCALPDFNILSRIRHHVEESGFDFQEHLNQIYGMEKTRNNYGTAARILEYLRFRGEETTVTLPDEPEQFLKQTEMQVEMQLRSFQERCALAMNCGQIIQSDAFCYSLEDTVLYWYQFCRQTKNYGFFTSILQHSERQIHISAGQYEERLNEQLNALIAGNRKAFEQHPDYEPAIRDQIQQQNFLVAEDWMHQVSSGNFNIEVQQPEALRNLDSFWTEYANNYKRTGDAGRSLAVLLNRKSIHNRDLKRGQQLLSVWINSGTTSNPERMNQLLTLLGWSNIQTERYDFAVDSRTEVYSVRKTVHTTGRFTPPHPIAAFGSRMDQDGMFAVCLYGNYDCDRLMAKISTLDILNGNKVILMDCALTSTDRRMLARKMKKRDSGLRNTYLFIDRVLISFLMDHYNENQNILSRMLMAVTMPFSYYQPYVVESAHTMPPEIFIGRADELDKIERADGVNLIYGGRQLGKSALLKKARANIDGDNCQRAVLVDIKDRDCASAARKLSAELIDLGILPDDMAVTENWEMLCRAIRQRLRRQDDELRYLLIMLDEADAFIHDCSNCNYQPLVELKDVQQTMPGRFKFVLAGLHNIVRFNREVALGQNAVITHLPSLKIIPFQPQTGDDENLLIVPLSYLGFSLPNKVIVSQILASTNRFPGLIQLYCQKLVESIRVADYAGYDIRRTPPYVITDDHLRRILADREFVEQLHEKLEITLRLDQDQGSCYYPIALLIGWLDNVEPSPNGYTAAGLLRHAQELQITPLENLDTDKINALLQELQDLNILRSISHDTYLLASKNFRDLLGSADEILDKLAGFSMTGGAGA